MPQQYGDLANAEEAAQKRAACLVCEDPEPRYSWTDLSGEAYCQRCGTPYQLKWGELKEGESYPRINIAEKWIPILRRYWQETERGNGSGTFVLWRDYPDQQANAEAFNDWLKDHEADLPPP